jgi:hypothetical protein
MEQLTALFDEHASDKAVFKELHDMDLEAARLEPARTSDNQPLVLGTIIAAKKSTKTVHSRRVDIDEREERVFEDLAIDLIPIPER